MLRYPDVVRIERQSSSIPAAEAAQSLIGQELDGRYRVDSPLGVGGMGAVYRATHLRLGRQVAIKVLLEQYGSQASFLVRFEREAKALASLRHPHIVSITDYGVAAGLPYLVMELLEGETLAARLRRAPFPPGQVLELSTQILRALSFVHERGLVHRDLKPGNIFLQRLPDGGEQLKLLDFGLAKYTHGDPEWVEQSLTNAGEIVGTPSYISPEQIACESADSRSDVYSMGVLLFEMLSGRLPFEGRPADQLKMHLVAPVPTLAQLCPGYRVSAELEAFLQRAMVKQREARFQDAAEMLNALDALPHPWLWADGSQPASGIALASTMLSPVPVEIGRNGAPPTRSLAPLGGRRGFWLSGGLAVSGIALLSAMFARDLLPASNSSADAASERQDPEPKAAAATIPTIVEPSSPNAAVRLEPEATVPSSPADPSANSAATDEAQAVLPETPNAAPSAAPDEAANEALGRATDIEPSPAATAEAPAVEAPAPSTSAEAGEVARDEPAIVHDPAPKAPAPSRVEARRTPSKNPWARNVPRELRAIRAAVAAGAVGSERTLQTLRNYNRAYPDDARGHLLLARVYLNRSWRTDALNQYFLAYRTDASARGGSPMLQDLVDMVARSPGSSEAGRLLREAYGSEALATIDRTIIARKKDPDSVARLRALRSRLATR
jgi:serine/threonine protein kinase